MKRSEHATRPKTPETHFVVSALQQLLMTSDMEAMFAFLHKLHIQWALGSDGKGKHRGRIFQNWRDRTTGEVIKVVEYDASGNSPKAALCLALCDFLMSEGDDFHAFINRGWPDK